MMDKLYFKTCIKDILIQFRNYKLRTILAMSSIVWGTMSIVLLQAFSAGFVAHNQQTLHELSKGEIVFYPNRTSIAYHGSPVGRKIKLTSKDLSGLKESVHGIKTLNLQFMKYNLDVSYNAQHHPATIVGSNQIDSEDKLTNKSRQFNNLDFKAKRRVVVISEPLSKILFSKKDPIGQYIQIKGVPFIVSGVMLPDEKNNWFDWQMYRIIMPYTTYQTIFSARHIDSFLVYPVDPEKTKTLIHDIIRYYANIFRFSSKDEDAFFIQDDYKQYHFQQKFSFYLSLFLSVCGIMTLCVGGVGIANILFLLVTEQRKVIGLRMACGATPSNIFQYYLLQAFATVFIAGFAGLGLSFCLLKLVNCLTLPAWLGHPTISVFSSFLIFLVLGTIGLIAGGFPALQASKLCPVDALKGE